MEKYNGDILNIMLCSTCNTNCKHCYISYKNNFDEKTLDEIISNFKGKKISLNGTEPLMFPEYLKYFKKVGQDFVYTNSKIITSDPQIFEKLKQNGITKVCMSYHYNLQHLVSDVSLEQVEKAIQLCQKNQIKVRILCSVTTTNYQQLDELCEKAVEMGVKEIQLTNFIVQGNAIKNNLSYLALSDEQILQALKTINVLREKYDKNTLFIDRCGSFGNSIGSKHYLCDAGINDVSITPDLKLYPCLFFAGVKQYEMGYYADGEFYITKKCEHNCDECLAKNVYNNHQDCTHIFK